MQFQPRLQLRGRLGQAFSGLRTHSSPSHLQFHQCLARHPQVGQRKQRHQVGRVLGQPPVLDLDVAELALDDPKRMLYLGAHAGLGLLQLLQDSAHRGVGLQRLALAGRHGHIPVGLVLAFLDFFTFLHAPVARVGVDVRLLAVQQRVRLGDVVLIGRRGRDRVHQPGVGIHTDVGFHAKVPLVALLGLVHLGVTLAIAVLGGAGRRYQRGIDGRALFEQQALGRQRGIDGGQDLYAEVVGFEQMAKAQDGAFIGQVLLSHVQADKLTVQRRVVQRFFHGRVRQVEPLLQAVDAQHGLHREGRASAFGAARRCVRRNQRHQLGPRHHQVHLIKELTLARALGLALESSAVQAHLLHGFSHACSVPTGGFCRVSLGGPQTQVTPWTTLKAVFNLRIPTKRNGSFKLDD